MRSFTYSILLLGLAQAASAAGLREALDRAWARNPQAQAAEAREAEARARVDAARSLLPGAPAVSLRYRTDQLTEERGFREYEAELELPLWLPGEQRARVELALREQAEALAALQAARLEIAGELRERVWAAALARSEFELARSRAETSQALEDDVARRVQAGELARTDLLLAKNETLAARAALLEAESREQQAQTAYLALTGDARLPEPGEEAPAPESGLDAHPALEARRQGIALALAKQRLALESRRDSPELALVTRRERAGRGDPWEDTWGLRLKIPFATDARNRPAIASANRELIQLEAEYRQARLRLEAEIAQKRREHESAVSQLRLAREKREVAAENLALIKKAFDLGEFELADLLRTRALAQEAELALAQQSVAMARARAALNQALGVLP
jgi:cobalt-zinc-cadmium efflux system outer membrane protein